MQGNVYYLVFSLKLRAREERQRGEMGMDSHSQQVSWIRDFGSQISEVRVMW